MADSSQRVRLEDLAQGMRVEGLVAGGPVTVLTTVQTAPEAFTVVFTRPDGNPDHVLALRSAEERLRIVAATPAVPFDGDAAEYRLAAEATRIAMAGQYDPMVAVTTSDMDPLPHQIDAVYGHLLAQGAAVQATDEVTCSPVAVVGKLSDLADHVIGEPKSRLP